MVSRQVARAHARAVQNDGAADQRLASLIAAAVAIALEQTAFQPGCARCVHEKKIAEAIAVKALEDRPETTVRQALTWQDGQPVCWEHFDEPAGG